MIRILDPPSIVFLVSLLAQWGAAYTGDAFRRWRPIGKNEREDFNTVLTATLTLLALIISFSFSMAVNRYDQRKNYEEERLTRSAPNMHERIYCQPTTGRSFASCYVNM